MSGRSKEQGVDLVRERMKKDRKRRFLLTLVFSFAVFCVLVITMTIMVILFFTLLKTGFLSAESIREGGILFPLLLVAVASVVAGTLFSMIFGGIPLRPFHSLIQGLDQLSEGEFDTSIDLGKMPVGQEISDSFNKLARELKNTEMLRSDFINNFSHEFKTPIVSVLGFAKLLKRGNLTEEQRMEYLDIIEEEAGRLSSMATNVLNLTKVENQTILTDVQEFNLSEQVRSCVLLLQKKWEKKNLSFSLEFREYMISANEELLKQVWINLLDNAIKYSPENETIEVGIRQADGVITVRVGNFGPPIPEKDLPLIMNKFYQADTSHASEGNGIGLAIVKQVVELHGGQVTVESSKEETVFSVMLPERR